MFDRKESKTISRPGVLEYFDDPRALFGCSSAAIADPTHDDRVAAKFAEWLNVFGLPWTQHESFCRQANHSLDVVCLRGYA